MAQKLNTRASKPAPSRSPSGKKKGHAAGAKKPKKYSRAFAKALETVRHMNRV